MKSIVIAEDEDEDEVVVVMVEVEEGAVVVEGRRSVAVRGSLVCRGRYWR